MSNTQIPCGFKPPLIFVDLDYQCHHPVQQDGLCIFHLPKPTEEEKKALAPEARTAVGAIEKEFHQTFLRLLENEEQNPEIKACDFRYFRFPAIFLARREFAKPLLLNGATFSGMAYFEGATFRELANFQGVTFSEWANFFGTTFSGKADFAGATFSESAHFFQATFCGEGDFSSATIDGGTYFPGANFGEKANFERATFNEVDLSDTTINAGLNFLGTTINGKINFQKTTTIQGECFFQGLDLDEKARVIFERVNLSQASFLDTNLEQIQFRDVTWCRRGRRQALWDEFPREGYQPDYEKVAENYRQLVLHYEAKRDFDTAEDFHIGEMEMRRKKPGRTYGYTLYWLASNYGTSYWQGLLVLVVLLALFSGIFLYTGLEPSTERADSLSAIEYDLCLNAACQHATWEQWIPDYARAVLFTLSLLTFQKERLYEPASECTLLWVCISVLVMAGQAALVLFAIRRRFRR